MVTVKTAALTTDVIVRRCVDDGAAPVLLGWTRRVERGQISDDWAWRSAVDLGERALAELELKAAAYACRRN